MSNIEPFLEAPREGALLLRTPVPPARELVSSMASNSPSFPSLPTWKTCSEKNHHWTQASSRWPLARCVGMSMQACVCVHACVEDCCCKSLFQKTVEYEKHKMLSFIWNLLSKRTVLWNCFFKASFYNDINIDNKTHQRSLLLIQTTDRGFSLVLLWAETGAPIENPPIWPNDPIPSHMNRERETIQS